MSIPTRRLLIAGLAAMLVGAAQAQGPATKAEPQGKPKTDENKIKRPVATLETAKGKIVIVLYPEEAPKTVENFVTLAKKGFYNGLKFHRVEKEFVIQGGDPEGNGTGGPGYVIKNEANKKLRHNRGAVAMANAGRDTAGSQFYIVISKPAPFLDEKYEDGVNKYTIFGQVIVGQEVAEGIAKDDKIIKVTVKP
jgi:peptidyl-prolyl cis-trans isomerase B (cyclophilin B)